MDPKQQTLTAIAKACAPEGAKETSEAKAAPRIGKATADKEEARQALSIEKSAAVNGTGNGNGQSGGKNAKVLEKAEKGGVAKLSCTEEEADAVTTIAQRPTGYAQYFVSYRKVKYGIPNRLIKKEGLPLEIANGTDYGKMKTCRSTSWWMDTLRLSVGNIFVLQDTKGQHFFYVACYVTDCSEEQFESDCNRLQYIPKNVAGDVVRRVNQPDCNMSEKKRAKYALIINHDAPKEEQIQPTDNFILYKNLKNVPTALIAQETTLKKKQRADGDTSSCDGEANGKGDGPFTRHVRFKYNEGERGYKVVEDDDGRGFHLSFYT